MDKYIERRDKYLSLHNAESLSLAEKRKLVEKLLVFDELIGLLIEWKKAINGQTEEEILKDLSFIPLMKCLYIVCLLSVHKNKPKNSLFNVFDNYVPYENGPVDEDCYYHINDLPHYAIDINKGVIIKRDCDNTASFVKRFGISEIDISSIINKIDTDGIKDMLIGAVNDLRRALYFPGFKDKYSLVNLTHRDLWEEANNENKPLNTSNWDALLKEARDIRVVIAA